MGDNSLYHVLALISKNHKYNKMKSSFIYLLFLEESHNPLRIKSLCGSSKNEVTSWQPFWFLHTCINCVDVQLTLCKVYDFLRNMQNTFDFSFQQPTALSFKTTSIILVILRKTIIFAHSDAGSTASGVSFYRSYKIIFVGGNQMRQRSFFDFRLNFRYAKIRFILLICNILHV